ncbi:MAG: HPr family phosphocarrier protein [Nocardioidaceae bacterium]
MVGIVVVSHSEPLATAAVELALQMVGDGPPPIEIAAGNDGGLGTDAVAVAEAIQRADGASGGTGVLVVTDLGSAILSAEMAVELADALSGEVLLSRAPFVEGLVAAVVQASIGKALADVEREAVAASGAKVAQLGPTDGSPDRAVPDLLGAARASDELTTQDVEIVNPQGLHARPAALLAKAAGELIAEVSLTNLETGAGPAAADSMLELMSLGVRQGNRVRLSADGPTAAADLDTLAALIAAGLGEAGAQ